MKSDQQTIKQDHTFKCIVALSHQLIVWTYVQHVHQHLRHWNDHTQADKRDFTANSLTRKRQRTKISLARKLPYFYRVLNCDQCVLRQFTHICIRIKDFYGERQPLCGTIKLWNQANHYDLRGSWDWQSRPWQILLRLSFLSNGEAA